MTQIVPDGLPPVLRRPVDMTFLEDDMVRYPFNAARCSYHLLFSCKNFPCNRGRSGGPERRFGDFNAGQCSLVVLVTGNFDSWCVRLAYLSVTVHVFAVHNLIL